jgi:pectate lyase
MASTKKSICNLKFYRVFTGDVYFIGTYFEHAVCTWGYVHLASNYWITVNNRLKGRIQGSRHTIIRDAVWISAGGNEKTDIQLQNSRYSGQYWNQPNVKYTSEVSSVEATSAVLVGWAESKYKDKARWTNTRALLRCACLHVWKKGCRLLSAFHALFVWFVSPFKD